MKKLQTYTYALFSGLLFALTWNNILPAVSLFVAFIPLLYLLNYKKTDTHSLFISSFSAFFIWHLFTVWWIYKSSIPGFISVITINSFFMAMILVLANFVKRVYGKFAGYWAFAVFWLSFENIHYYWDLQWPFMNLGNWLGQVPVWIQWYEYTGVSGGTLWILLVNIFLLESYMAFREENSKSIIINLVITLFLLLFPTGTSFSLFPQKCGSNPEFNALIIQPNINPYTEKYNTNLFKKQITEQLQMAETNLDSSIRLLIFPETSLPLYLNKNNLKNNPVLNSLKRLSEKYPKLSVIAGIYTYRITGSDTLYYNTAIFINKDGNYTMHDKSKLVPGVERTPFIRFLNVFKNMNVNFGGINASLHTNNEQTVFANKDLKIAPLICYESVFGTYTTQFVENGANILAVITNDAWWGDTPAYEQILMHSKLRAIETRRQVIRAANTGISGLIDEKGKLTGQLPLNQKSVLKIKIKTNIRTTFFVAHGDIISRISIFTAIILLLASFVKKKAKMSNKF